MEGALWILVVTVIIGLALWLSDRFYFRKKFPEESSEKIENKASTDDEECCGMHDVCEKTSLAIVTDEYQYYDDEELDIYKGRSSDQYSLKEIEEFRDVLLTLRPDDVSGWAKSISLRGIELPTEVRDELLMIVEELRVNSKE